jgi:hypothetical protein
MMAGMKSVAPQKKQTSQAGGHTLRLLVASLALALVTFMVYRGSLDNDFVDWDDYTYVIQNDLVRSIADITRYPTSVAAATQQHIGHKVSPYTTTLGDVFRRPVSNNYHPVTILTMRWNNNACPRCTNGISAEPFIRWNIILHILNSVLVLLLTFRMSRQNVLASILAAAIFALHPMHVESVVWVSERKDVLYTFLFLGGLLTYIGYLQGNGRKWLIATFCLFLLSCLSKAAAVVFPLVMLLLYFWFDKAERGQDSLRNTLRPKAMGPTLPFFAAALFFGLMAMKVQSGENFLGLLEVHSDAVGAIRAYDTFPLTGRLQVACYGFLQYILRFFFPSEMCAFYPYPPQAEYGASPFLFLAPFIVLGLLAGALASVRYTKSIAVGLGFYLFTILLVLQFIPVGTVIMADRYTYLPYVGLAFMLVMLIQEFLPRRMQVPAYGVLGAFCVFVALKTPAQVESWQDSETLWTNVIDLNTSEDGRIHPKMELPLSNRGSYYGKMAERLRVAGDRKGKQDYLERALREFELSAGLGSRRPELYEGMGNTYGMMGDYQRAIDSYSRALELDPDRGTVYFNRGLTYGFMRQHENAIADYTMALRYAPSQALMSYVKRGISYAALGQRDKAIDDFRKALRINPRHDTASRYLRALTGEG